MWYDVYMNHHYPIGACFTEYFNLGDDDLGPALGLWDGGYEDAAVAYLVNTFDLEEDRAQDALAWHGRTWR